jgi:hypothetical protein
MLFYLLSLNAQDKKKTDMQSNDSILLKRINPEEMFRKQLAQIDSTDFDAHKINKQLKTIYPDYRQWRFGVNGGAEIIIAPEPANISEEFLKYKKTLKSGIRFGADALFFTSPNIGVGLNYSTYNANNKTNYIAYELNGIKHEGSRQDDISIHFVGPKISIRSIPKHNKFYTSCDFILGYFTYSNNLILNNTTYHLKEDNFGFATSVGADYMFIRSMSLGLSLNIIAASVKNVEILSGSKVENLSRVSLTLMLKTYR